METTALRLKILSYLRNIWFLWIVCFAFNILTFFALFYKIHAGNETLALHYNVIAGVLWYGRGKNLYFIPGIGLAVIIANLALFKTGKTNENFLGILCALAALFTQIILLAATLFLIKIN